MSQTFSIVHHFLQFLISHQYDFNNSSSFSQISYQLVQFCQFCQQLWNGETLTPIIKANVVEGTEIHSYRYLEKIQYPFKRDCSIKLLTLVILNIVLRRKVVYIHKKYKPRSIQLMKNFLNQRMHQRKCVWGFFTSEIQQKHIWSRTPIKCIQLVFLL